MARVLICDDEVEICQLIEGAFYRRGHDVTMVHDGRSALEALREDFYDALILDLVMPGISGDQVLDYREEFADTAVIILTAHSSTSTAIKALRNRVSDYLEKPIELGKLVSMVESCVAWHSYGPFKIHIPSHRAFYNDTPVDMPTGLFYIFSIFVKNPQRYFTHQELVTQMVTEYPDYFNNKRRSHIATQVRQVGGIEQSVAVDYVRGQISRLRREVLDKLAGMEVIVDQTELGFRLNPALINE